MIVTKDLNYYSGNNTYWACGRTTWSYRDWLLLHSSRIEIFTCTEFFTCPERADWFLLCHNFPVTCPRFLTWSPAFEPLVLGCWSRKLNWCCWLPSSCRSWFLSNRGCIMIWLSCLCCLLCHSTQLILHIVNFILVEFLQLCYLYLKLIHPIFCDTIFLSFFDTGNFFFETQLITSQFMQRLLKDRNRLVSLR